MKGLLIGLIIATIGGIGVTAIASENDTVSKASSNVEQMVNSEKSTTKEQVVTDNDGNEFCDDDCRDGYHDDDCKKDNLEYREAREKIEKELVSQFGENWKETLKAEYGSEWDDIMEDKLEMIYGDDLDDILDDIFCDDNLDDKDDYCDDLNDDCDNKNDYCNDLDNDYDDFNEPNTCDDDCRDGYHDDDCNLNRPTK